MGEVRRKGNQERGEVRWRWEERQEESGRTRSWERIREGGKEIEDGGGKGKR